tara:strand:- start:338 stop:463 length:126 start_codon:yes stop_codon:yes gene_type:complete
MEESVIGYLIILFLVCCVWVKQEYDRNKKQYKVERYRRRFN